MKSQKNNLDLTLLKKQLKELAEKITYQKRFPIKEAECSLKNAKGPKAKEKAAAHLNKVRKEQKEMSTDYRYLHVAYGEMRGIPRKKMEHVVRTHELDEQVIQKIKARFV
ncbi:MAG TPA: hypothetical protein PKC87_04210 [Candidatus Absconditabacterales bacterium]|nr:hypothetical protein [Candidatus Absconditabacterales bacterium]